MFGPVSVDVSHAESRIYQSEQCKLEDLIETCDYIAGWSYPMPPDRIASYPIQFHASQAHTTISRPFFSLEGVPHSLYSWLISYPILSYPIRILSYPHTKVSISHPILSNSLQPHTTKAFTFEVRRSRTRYTQTCAHLLSHPILSLKLSYRILCYRSTTVY
jgi:hypothetical protein